MAVRGQNARVGPLLPSYGFWDITRLFSLDGSHLNPLRQLSGPVSFLVFCLFVWFVLFVFFLFSFKMGSCIGQVGLELMIFLLLPSSKHILLLVLVNFEIFVMVRWVVVKVVCGFIFTYLINVSKKLLYTGSVLEHI